MKKPRTIYRRPPPRRVRSRKDGNKEEEEEIKEVVGGTNYLRRCKGTEWSVAESIPDELLFEILLRLPAQDIYYESRLVCRKWYHMMRTKDFIHQHLEHASYGLLYIDESHDVVFISAREGGEGMDTYKLKFKTRCAVWCSCNGLMLEYQSSFEKNIYYYVINISTDQAFRLPLLPYFLCGRQFSCIGYDATSMTYKVVVSCQDRGHGFAIECVAILTVGVDKSWRRVCTNHLSVLGRHTIMSRPIFSEGGFVHWNKFGGTEVVTLNLETEIIAETPPPIRYKDLLGEKINCCCLSTGRYLSLFLRRGNLVWEVFEMKPEIGEWRKLPNICLEGQKGRIIERVGFKFKHDSISIRPCCWLKYPEVLAFFIENNSIIFYNLITCEIGAEKLSVNIYWHGVTLHKNSLIWLGGS
ncbi:hypothetical protein ACS0TY_022725 [Phlomoides rotata]